MSKQTDQRKPATLVVDGQEIERLPATLGQSAVPDVHTDTAMSPEQQRNRDQLITDIRRTVMILQDTRRAEGREIHAVIVAKGGELMRLIRDTDGPDEAFKRIRDVWNPFLDLKTTPESHSISSQTLRGRTEVMTAKVNTGYRQYFTKWDFLIACQAGLYKEKWNLPPEALRLHGRDYRTPAEALADGNTLTDVHQCWANIVKPVITILEDLPTLREHQEIFEDALESVAGMGVVLRATQEYEEKGQTKRRWHRKKFNLVPKQNVRGLPPSAWAGFFAGLLAEAHRQGILVQPVKLPGIAEPVIFTDFLKVQMERPTFSLPQNTGAQDDDEDDFDDEPVGKVIDKTTPTSAALEQATPPPTPAPAPEPVTETPTV